MKSKKKQFLKKIIMIFLSSILVTIVLEILFFNFHALFKDNAKEIELENYFIEHNADGSKTIKYEFNDLQYINKIYVVANTETNQAYEIEIDYQNQFDIEKQIKANDIFLWTNNRHYTILNKDVLRFKITIPSQKVEILGVGVENGFSINKYRVLFIFSVCFCVANIVFLSSFYKKRLELIFMIIGLLMGVCMIGMQGTSVMGWDEETHFEISHSLGYKDVIERSVSTELIRRATILEYDTIEEKEQVIAFFNQNGEYLKELEKYKDNNTIQYNQVGHLPSAISFKIGNMLGLDFNKCFMLGRFGNLCFYLIMIFYAIKIVEVGKIIILCISLMPTPLFMACTYTYDSFLYASIVLAFAILFNLLTNKDKEYGYQPLIVAALVTIGCLPKAVYIPLILLILLLVKKSEKSDRYAKIYNLILAVCVIALFIVVMSTFVVPTASNTVSNNVSYGGDPRGGETSAVLQLLSILKHPFDFCKLLLSEIVTLDNFRNFGVEYYDHYLPTNLCFLTVGKYGTMPDKYVFLLIPYLFFMLRWSKEKTLEIKDSVCVLLSILTVIGLIWSALYLAFTPIGGEEILGVQARYYLPLIIPAMLSVPKTSIFSSSCESKRKENQRIRYLLMTALFFLVYSIWILIFKSTCL